MRRWPAAVLTGIALITAARCAGGQSDDAPANAVDSAAAAVVEPPASAAVESFWIAFRQATLSGEAIAALTRFAFRTRGPSDDDAIREHDRGSFTAMLGSSLARVEACW